MLENTRSDRRCPPAYCPHCDLFAELDGLHVIDVERPPTTGVLQVVVETAQSSHNVSA